MKFKLALLLLLLTPLLVAWGQVRAGTAEDRLFAQIAAEANADTKLALISTFESEFPQSKILAKVYLMAVDVYREKKDRDRINEYGEKALQLDDKDITAMMLLARSYAMEAKNLDRAVDLSRRALNRLQAMRTTEGLPAGYSLNQWKDYLRASEDSAEQILQYVNAVKTRAEAIRNSQVGRTDAAASVPAQTSQPTPATTETLSPR